MKKISARSAALSVLLAAPLLMVSATRAGADVDFGANVSLGFHAGDADVGVFYDSLAPYGDWVDTDRYGLCWTPRRVEQDWRPYYYGHWVYTDDYGWMWVGDEEWGWAAYHYGRWAFDPAYGWVWVPGSVWAPAWVAWRYGEGYAGWAPLPPEADPSMGPADFGIDPLSFVFVEERYLPEPVLVDRYVPPARNVTIVHVTQNVTNYRVVNNQVVNHGVPVQTVERVTGRAVPRVRVAEQTAPSRTAVRGGQVAIYRPPVPKAPAGSPRPRATAPRPGTAQHPPAGTEHPTGPTTGTQRAPAVAQPSTTDPAELQRRHVQEQQALQAKEAQEREKLRQIQEKEKAAPPPNVSQQQLERQHQEEQKAQAEHEQRQKEAQQQRQAREKQAAQQQQKEGQGQKQQGQQHQPAKNDKEKKKPEDKQ